MTKCSRTVVAQNDYFYVTPGLSVKNFPPDARTGSASARRSQGQRRLTGGFRQIFRRMIAAQRDPQPGAPPGHRRIADGRKKISGLKEPLRRVQGHALVAHEQGHDGA